MLRQQLVQRLVIRLRREVCEHLNELGIEATQLNRFIDVLLACCHVRLLGPVVRVAADVRKHQPAHEQRCAVSTQNFQSPNTSDLPTRTSYTRSVQKDQSAQQQQDLRWLGHLRPAVRNVQAEGERDPSQCVGIGSQHIERVQREAAEIRANSERCGVDGHREAGRELAGRMFAKASSPLNVNNPPAVSKSLKLPATCRPTHSSARIARRCR